MAAVSGEDASRSSVEQKPWCSQPCYGKVALGAIGWEQFRWADRGSLPWSLCCYQIAALKLCQTHTASLGFPLSLANVLVVRRGRSDGSSQVTSGLSFCTFPVSSQISELLCFQLSALHRDHLWWLQLSVWSGYKLKASEVYITCHNFNTFYCFDDLIYTSTI